MGGASGWGLCLEPMIVVCMCVCVGWRWRRSTWTGRTLSPPSWSSVQRVMLTVHSWQSVSSPPTTMRLPRCGERRLGCSLNPAAAAGLAAFDLFSFKGFKCSRFCTLERHFSLHQPGREKKKKRNVKAPSTCYRQATIQIRAKRLNGIESQRVVDWFNKSHLLSGASWCKLAH